MALRILIFSISLCFGLLVIEAMARFCFKSSTTLFPRYHTSAQYGDFSIRRLRPKEVFKHTSVDGQWIFRTNLQGYRNDQDFEYEKPKGCLRILVLGDSHTEGFEVNQEETYSSRLFQTLKSEFPVVEVMNVGVSGFGNAESLIYAEKEGLKYLPDFVILGFFANDLEDNIKSGLFGLDAQEQLIVLKKSHLPGVRLLDALYCLPATKWLGENSYAYSILFNSAWDFSKRLLSRHSKNQAEKWAASNQKDFSNYEINLATTIIMRLQALCRKNGAVFILVDIPQLSPQGGVASSLPLPMRRILASQVDAFLDVSALIQGTPLEKESHLPHGQRHISSQTHNLIAHSIAEVIAKKYLSSGNKSSHQDGNSK